jgi:hypothetical protein
MGLVDIQMNFLNNYFFNLLKFYIQNKTDQFLCYQQYLMFVLIP